MGPITFTLTSRLTSLESFWFIRPSFEERVHSDATGGQLGEGLQLRGFAGTSDDMISKVYGYGNALLVNWEATAIDHLAI